MLFVYAQETTYTHTDAADYMPGDRIWLKVYVVDLQTHKPASPSLYAYTELTDADGTLVSRAKLLQRNGVYAGHLDIPETASRGRYWVHSYTKASLNTSDGGCFCPIYIGIGENTKSITVTSLKGDGLLRQVENWQFCNFTVETDKESYRPFDTVAIRLKAPDLHEGEAADISISVTGTTPAHRHRPASIKRLLPSAVQEGEYLPAETTQVIAGRVLTLVRRRPVARAKVDLISPKVQCFATTETDSNGLFTFPGMDFPEGTQFVLQAADHKGRTGVELIVDEDNPPAFKVPTFSESEAEWEWMENDTTTVTEAGGTLLNSVEVTGRRRNSSIVGDVYAQSADFTFGLQKIEAIGATCLHELLRRIPGLRVERNRCYIRAATSIYADNPAAIAIDGVIVPEEYDLDNIQMQDVARVDMYKTGATVIWGWAGGSGVVNVTTKDGTYGELPASHPNQKKVTPLGYQHHATFHARLNDFRTLCWNPNVFNDIIPLTAPAKPGICLLVLEGITTEGRLIHEEKEIIIHPK